MLLTKRAALMDSQVDVLEGKQRALARFRDGLAAYAEALAAVPAPAPADKADGKAAAALRAADPIGSLPPAVSRLLLAAQEDMRREIARAMHDGPAQSLTNIVLQAQIVEHLVANDPKKASGEVRQLVAMVQHTLDATKSFIFDVRPMVLDDLGLVPTLRRAARDRGRRAGVPVEFESMGQDRRLPMDLESGLFRILDEALVGVSRRPRRAGLAQAGLVGSPRGRHVRLACAGQARVRAGAGRCAERGPPAGARRDDGGAAGRRPRPRCIGPAGRDRHAPAVDLARDPGPGGHARAGRRAVGGRVRAQAGHGAAAGRRRFRNERAASPCGARGWWSTA